MASGMKAEDLASFAETPSKTEHEVVGVLQTAESVTDEQEHFFRNKGLEIKDCIKELHVFSRLV